MSVKLTAEESCRQVLKSIADECDAEALARADGYLCRYVREETVLRDCGQRGVCRTPPGCARHWEERNRELLRDNEKQREEFRQAAVSDLLRLQATRDNWKLLAKKLVRLFFEYVDCVGVKAVQDEYAALRDAMAEARTLILSDEGKAP